MHAISRDGGIGAINHNANPSPIVRIVRSGDIIADYYCYCADNRYYVPGISQRVFCSYQATGSDKKQNHEESRLINMGSVPGFSSISKTAKDRFENRKNSSRYLEVS